MPVIRIVPQDPTDLVMQGEQLRAATLIAPIAPSGGQSGLMDAVGQSWSFLVADDDEEDTGMMGDGVLPLASLRSNENLGLVSANASISTPCGALIPVYSRECLISGFVQSSSRWVLSGQTLDLNSVALPNCRVIIFDTGRLAVSGLPVVAEAISDGSGNYSIEVPQNTIYQATAYLVGSPDRAGVTVNNLTPTQV